MTTKKVAGVKKAAPTSATAWKKGTGTHAAPLEVPSGNVALVKNPGMRVFMKKGMIPNSLLGIVTEALDRGESPSGAVLGKKIAEQGGEAVEQIFDLVDAVVVECVVEPKVHAVPEGGEERDDNLLYVDEVDLDDKMFIFQWVVGGTRDLEQFRKEYASSMANVQHSENVEVSS